MYPACTAPSQASTSSPPPWPCSPRSNRRRKSQPTLLSPLSQCPLVNLPFMLSLPCPCRLLCLGCLFFLLTPNPVQKLPPPGSQPFFLQDTYPTRLAPPPQAVTILPSWPDSLGVGEAVQALPGSVQLGGSGAGGGGEDGGHLLSE